MNKTITVYAEVITHQQFALVMNQCIGLVPEEFKCSLKVVAHFPQNEPPLLTVTYDRPVNADDVYCEECLQRKANIYNEKRRSMK